jgi:quinol monooxygenase YgiN
MHTLIIEGSLKPDKKDEFLNAWKKEILPTLKKQNGFVKETLLFETENPNRGVGLSFWKTREAAQKYHREVFPRLVSSVQDMMQAAPTVRSVDVEASETFRIAAGQSRLIEYNNRKARGVQPIARFAGCSALVKTKDEILWPQAAPQNARKDSRVLLWQHGRVSQKQFVWKANGKCRVSAPPRWAETGGRHPQLHPFNSLAVWVGEGAWRPRQLQALRLFRCQ